MKFIVFSDLHFHEHPEFVESKDGINPYLSISLSCLKQIREYAAKHNIKNIFHAGDLFHTRNRIPVNLIVLLQKEFSSWINDFGISKLYFIRGNPWHDGYGENFCGRLFECIGAESVNDVGEFYDGIDSVLFLAYNSRRILLEEIKKFVEIHKKKRLILIVHKGLQGAKIRDDYELKEDDVLTMNDVANFHAVLAGHYHRYQKVFDNAWHIGSPYRIDFSEENDKKGFIVYNEGEIRFVELDVPEMKTIKVSKEYSDSIFDDKVSGSFVRVLVEGSKSFLDNFRYDEIKSKILSCGALGVKFVKNVIENVKEYQYIRIDKSSSLTEMIDRYLDYLKDEIKDFDIEKLRKIGYQAISSQR